MTYTRTAVAAVALAAATLVTGCSSSSGQQSSGSSAPPTTGASATTAHSGQVVTIHTTNDLRFQPSTVTVDSQTVKVKLVNDGSYPHNLQLSNPKFTSQTINGDPGNQTTTFTLHFPKPGTYSFICTYHSSAGMRGEFVVK